MIYLISTFALLFAILHPLLISWEPRVSLVYKRILSFLCLQRPFCQVLQALKTQDAAKFCVVSTKKQC
nr:hypothetical protein [uncultured Campylobacter sp.]